MKDVNQTIAARAYLATDAQVRELALLSWSSNDAVSSTRGTFLRVELASLQAALMGSPKQRAGGKPQSFEKDAVLSTLNDVHSRLYALVLDAVVTDDIKDAPKLRQAEKTRRAQERNRRSNFARSAKSTLLGFIRAGGNICSLVVPQVSKAQIAAETAKRKPQPDQAEQAERIANRMAKQIENIREDDHELAQMIAQKLTMVLAPVTVEKTTKSPAKSVETGTPLQLGEGIFLPMPAANLSEIKPEQRTAH